MAAILHRLIIETSPEKLYRALTEQQLLSDWWTKTETDSKVGGQAHFRFGDDPAHHVIMEIVALEPSKKVVWQCVQGPWVDTGKFTFDIAKDDRGAVLKFTHEGWPSADDFYRHCNSKWGFFFTASLKSLLEKGIGSPFPNDPRI